jgi:hypothetical protein
MAVIRASMEHLVSQQQALSKATGEMVASPQRAIILAFQTFHKRLKKLETRKE